MPTQIVTEEEMSASLREIVGRSVEIYGESRSPHLVAIACISGQGVLRHTPSNDDPLPEWWITIRDHAGDAYLTIYFRTEQVERITPGHGISPARIHIALS